MIIGPAWEVRCSYAKLTCLFYCVREPRFHSWSRYWYVLFPALWFPISSVILPLYHLISGVPGHSEKISPVFLAVWLLKIHNKQIYHGLKFSVQKMAEGLNFSSILKINFICKYNTGWKLQKTFLKKEI